MHISCTWQCADRNRFKFPRPPPTFLFFRFHANDVCPRLFNKLLFAQHSYLPRDLHMSIFDSRYAYVIGIRELIHIVQSLLQRTRARASWKLRYHVLWVATKKRLRVATAFELFSNAGITVWIITFDGGAIAFSESIERKKIFWWKIQDFIGFWKKILKFFWVQRNDEFRLATVLS